MGKIYYIMGKSSSGKDTLFRKIKQELPMLQTVTLYTTRPKREGEREGVESGRIRLSDDRNAGVLWKVKEILRSGVSCSGVYRSRGRRAAEPCTYERAAAGSATLRGDVQKISRRYGRFFRGASESCGNKEALLQ